MMNLTAWLQDTQKRRSRVEIQDLL